MSLGIQVEKTFKETKLFRASDVAPNSWAAASERAVRRERYALAAFAALLTGDPAVFDKNFTDIAKDAVQAADALIEALDGSK